MTGTRLATAALLAASVVGVTVVMDPSRREVFSHPKYYLLGWVAVGLLVLMAAGIATGSTRLRLDRVVDPLVAGWVVLNVVAYLDSIDRSASLHGEPLQRQGLLATLLYVVAFYAARVVARPRLVAWAATVAGAWAAGYGILQQLDLDPVWDVLLDDRIFSFIGQPNPLAALLVMGLPLAAYATAAARTMVGRVVAGTSAAMVGIALALTFSRGAYLAAIVMVAVTTAAIWRHVDHRRIGRIAGAAAIAVVLLTALTPVRSTGTDIIDRGGSIFSELDASNRRRVDLWVVGLSIAAEYPWTGAGHETYPQLFREHARDRLSRDRQAAFAPFRPESPHNVYIAAADNAGIPAALAYLGILGVVTTRLWRRVRRAIDWWAAALLGAISAHLVTDFFITAEFAGSWLFWILLGSAVGLEARDPHRGAGSVQPVELQQNRGEGLDGGRVGQAPAVEPA